MRKVKLKPPEKSKMGVDFLIGSIRYESLGKPTPMRNMTSYLIGMFLGSSSTSRLEKADKQAETEPSNRKDPVLNTLPFLHEYITEELIDKAYKQAEKNRNCNIQRRSSRKLTSRILVLIEIHKALHDNISYKQSMSEVWSQLRDEGIVDEKRPSTGSLSEARQRFPVEVYKQIFNALNNELEGITDQLSWRQYRIKTIDGVPVTLPNERALRTTFKVHSNKQNEAYYPKAEYMFLADAGTGCILEEHLLDRDQGEESIAPHLLENRIRPNDLVLGDAKYGTTAPLAVMDRQGAYFVCRAHTSIDVEQHIVKTVKETDYVVGVPITDYMKEKYCSLELPDTIRLRAVEIDGDYFLTNLDRNKHPVEQIEEQIYPLRWSHEVLHREIKSDQNLEGPRSRREQTIHQEVYANLIVYNLVRYIMYQSLACEPKSCGEKQATGKDRDSSTDQKRSFRNRQSTQPSQRLLGIKKEQEKDPLEIEIRTNSFLSSLRHIRHTNRKVAETDLTEPEGRKKCKRYIRNMMNRIQEGTINKRPDRLEPRMVRPSKRNYTEFVGSRKEWKRKHADEAVG